MSKKVKRNIKNWKCLIVYLVIGHSDTVYGREVNTIKCNGCGHLVFTRK